MDSYEFLRQPLSYENNGAKILEQIRIENGFDIPLFEAGYEELAKKGDHRVGVLLHDEDVPVGVRGYSERFQGYPEGFEEVRRRGPGGTVEHGTDSDTDCLTVGLPVDEEFDVEVGWRQFAHGVKAYLEELGVEDMYFNGRDILVQQGGRPEPLSDPQVAGTSIRKGVDYAVARACVKNNWAEELAPMLESDHIDPEEYRQKSYFVEEEHGSRFSDVLLPEAYFSRNVENWLRREGVYEEAWKKARDTQQLQAPNDPENCVLGFRQ